MSDSHFSKTYSEARHRFIDAAERLDATVSSYAVDAESADYLAIDVAVLGTEDDPAVVISSGVHGVEGFLGSAVQLALLQQLHQQPARPGIRYVLIHSVNPYGFSQLRRWNEDNVDLNRNFLTSGDDYTGSPVGYHSLNGFLNPASPPLRFEPFIAKAIWQVLRNGLPTLKETIAGGQYEYPRGVFFGGTGPCESTKIVQENCDAWLGASQRIVHVDFHSGLGPFGTYKLLLVEAADSERLSWYTENFGAESIEAVSTSDGTAYPVSGSFAAWLAQHFVARDYRAFVAEFGTYGVVRVLGAVCAENRAHHYGSADSPLYQAAKRELLECFCPRDPAWRRKVVDSGLEIIRQAVDAQVPARNSL